MGECQVSPDFGKTQNDNVRLVLFQQKAQEDNFLKAEFAVGQKYSFNCVGGWGEAFYPHFWNLEK